MPPQLTRQQLEALLRPRPNLAVLYLRRTLPHRPPQAAPLLPPLLLLEAGVLLRLPLPQLSLRSSL